MGQSQLSQVAASVEAVMPARCIVAAASPYPAPLPDDTAVAEPFSADLPDHRIARGQMLAGIVHDIRSPLQVIAMSTELLTATSSLSPGGVVALTRMRRAVGRILDMLDEVVATSSHRARALAPLPRTIAIETLLGDALAMMKPIAECKQIHLRIGASTALGSFDVDYEGLMRIFSNLIDNAIKFSPKGSEIKIAARREHVGIRFAVIDQGIGISALDLPCVFDRCWQANPCDGEGLGLGLSIVREIVESNGGTVGVCSVLGRGCEIYFTIPML